MMGRWTVRRNTPSTAGRRIAHLLFLVGFAVGAYIALSAFDRAAWADDGLPGPPASVVKPVAGAGKVPSVPGLTRRTSPDSAATGRRAVPRVEHRKAAAPKPVKQSAVTPNPAKRTAVNPRPKAWTSPVSKAEEWSNPVRKVKERANPVPAAKVAARGLSAEVRKTSARQVETVDAAARHLITQVAPVTAPALPESPTDLILDARRELIAALLPAGASMPAIPVPALPGPVTVGALPATPSVTVAQEAPSSTTASPPLEGSVVTPVPTTPADPATSTPRVGAHVAAHAGTGLSPAPARPAPPVSPSRPGGQSAGGGQFRDSGGGAPPTAVVPSAWWPALTATSIRPPTKAIATGRSVRYSGPPS
jgi:hypothetical protein